ncbi:MAG: DNA mismatch repair protein [Caeruleum heppii]|nr:MAG: DNA mismatch repair protein [Caeruleum heppii]
MNDPAACIVPLPPDVIAQIESSSTVTSLAEVVVGLVKNALDADAASIHVTIDPLRGNCTVEDDGMGIFPTEFLQDGGLGKMYHSSKRLSSNETHGRNGSFLASVAAQSLLTITSRHFAHRSNNTLIIHRSSTVKRLLPAPATHQLVVGRGHGTRVTIKDLFGTMPVRVKQRALAAQQHSSSDKDWSILKKEMVALLLAWRKDVVVTLRDAPEGKKLTLRRNGSHTTATELRSESQSDQCSRDVVIVPLQSLLTQAAYITPDSWPFWVSVAASSPSLSVSGAISLTPSPTKQTQFISLGIRPISRGQSSNILYEEINRLFAASDFGRLEDEGADIGTDEEDRRAKDRRFRQGYTVKQLKGRKGLDRWPTFVLQFNNIHSTTDGLEQAPPEMPRTFRNLNALVELVTALIERFLQQHHFQPRPPKRLRRQPSIKEVEHLDDDKSEVQCANQDSMPCDEKPGEGLASEVMPVRRKRPRFEPDVLGGGVKLPCFSRDEPSNSNSRISQWSKMKSARALEAAAGISSNSQVPNKDQRLSLSQRRAPAEEGHQPSSDARAPMRALTSESTDCTVSATHPPPDITSDQQSRYDLEDAVIPSSAGTSQPLADDFIEWTNAITKATFSVNTRTGMAVPRAPQRPQSAIVRSNTSRPRSGPSLDGFGEKPRPFTTGSLSLPTRPTSAWLGDVLQNWSNPIFRPAELQIPRVSPENLEGMHNGGCSHGFLDLAQRNPSAKTKLSRKALRDAHVIGQVDRKFILVKMDSKDDSADTEEGDGSSLLVLIDQHAADERCRIEVLLEELCTPDSSADALTQRSTSAIESKYQIRTTTLHQPIIFEASPQEVALFEAHQQHLANWGILYDLRPCTTDAALATNSCVENTNGTIRVRALPPGISERCQTDPRLVIDLLRAEIWTRSESKPSTNMSARRANTHAVAAHASSDPSSLRTPPEPLPSWLSSLSTCPRGLIDLLNSRACRSAIMFNDALSASECRALVSRLATCRFPFICAHGRVSMVPLVAVPRSSAGADAGGEGLMGGGVGGLPCGSGSVDGCSGWV